MKLIIDCGSTKADWIILDDGVILKKIKTEGFNPNYTDKDSILGIVVDETSYQEYVQSITEVYFYGSGCGNIENCNKIKDILSSIFTYAKIEVTHDMMAACRAVLGENKGIACILGTGSNSCCYNGELITEQSVSLGYVLGDEGSGSYIGKNLIRDYFYKKMPKDLSVDFEESYDINIKTVINRIYHDTQVSRYFASFAKFAYKNIENQYIQDLCSRCFDEFIDNFIIIYEHAKETEIGFVGSIAYYFRDIIKCRLETKGLKPGEIIKDPIDGLVEFHSK